MAAFRECFFSPLVSVSLFRFIFSPGNATVHQKIGNYDIHLQLLSVVYCATVPKTSGPKRRSFPLCISTIGWVGGGIHFLFSVMSLTQTHLFCFARVGNLQAYWLDARVCLPIGQVLFWMAYISQKQLLALLPSGVRWIKGELRNS